VRPLPCPEPGCMRPLHDAENDSPEHTAEPRYHEWRDVLPPIPYVPLDPGYPDAAPRLSDAIDAACPTLPDEKNAIDLGAGEGFVARRLEELGWDVTALEGQETARARSVFPRLTHPYDLRMPFSPSARMRWELVVCTEVAEHIEPGFEARIVEHVARRAGHMIVWSAAPPGQEWDGHVNLRPAAYWLDLFDTWGIAVAPKATEALRSGMALRAAQHAGARESFYVLRKLRT
jgi:hypothetical protein